VTWLAYSTLAYLFLAIVRIFRVYDGCSLYLAGAIYGWLTEGGLTHTLYGTEETAPFPISICITGLSWHALISVLVGWYATGKALTASRPAWIGVVSAGIGAFWGWWATFLWHENPPVITSVPGFLGYAITMTLLLTGAWWLNFRFGLPQFRPGFAGVILSLTIIGAFYVQHVLRLGWLPLVVLPAVLSIAVIPLWLHRRRQFGVAAIVAGPLVNSRLLWLGLMPITATVVYAVARPLGVGQWPVASIVYFWITGPVGFLLWVVATIQCCRRKCRAGSS
jgi:hypothetical protein